eukprot:gb/GFBE01030742.1/.p1 GENE.gb/GFBE01030742.1/~~gb/GFBE01030742.1/.p1  ORF type:complete len:142 (+),score=28.41 gb/GFBE01030742.1/:1-426(+)
MDTNDDGVLELAEVRNGFEKILGNGSAQLEEIDDVFSRLDIDGLGAIDYTEFCAAGLGDRMSGEVEVGCIQGLRRARLRRLHHRRGDHRGAVRSRRHLASGNLRTLGARGRRQLRPLLGDGNGVLDFDEWVQMMQQGVTAN